MKKAIIIILFFVFTGCASTVTKISKRTEPNAILSIKQIDDITTKFERPPVLAQNFIWGINGHPITSPDYWELSTMDFQVEAMQHLQTSMYRFNFFSDDSGDLTFYKNDKYRWDEIKVRCDKAGIDILPVIQFKPLGTSITEAQSYQAGLDKAYGFAKRYGADIDYYELGNELDLVLIKSGENGSKKEHYHKDEFDIVAAYLKGMHEGVKRADPTAKTIINCAGGNRWGFFKLLKEANVPYDITGWHWYSHNGTYEAPYVKKQTKQDIYVELAKISDRPIWITEINQSKGTFKYSKEAQAVWTGRLIDALDKNTKVEAYFVYELLNQPNLDDNIDYEHPVEAYFGLVDASNVAQPVYNPAFETLSFKIEENLHWRTNYLTHLYSKLLGRDAKPSEVDVWKENLANNSLNEFINGFYHVENPKISNVNNLLFIENSYQQLFDITISKKESKFWLKKLKNGASQLEISKELVLSRKFYRESIISGYNKRTGFTFKK